MTSPYRIKDEVSHRERPNAELVYDTRDREKHVAVARTAVQISIVGVVAGILATAAGSPTLAVGILLAATVLGIWRWRRAPGAFGILLRVDDGGLVVVDRSTKKVVARSRLADLRNVTLDTKSIRKVEPGRDVVPAVQFISSQIGPEIDVARIVLEVEGRPAPIRLTDAFLPHTDSIEWIAKIRVFLRAHGWLPEDERERVSIPDEEPVAPEVSDEAHCPPLRAR